MDKVNAAVYVRVSTTKQEADNQLIQLREYCDKQNYEIFREYKDIISGKEESRPEWNQLFEDARKLKFDIVVFWALDRFSRSGTLFTLQKLRELSNLKIKWHSYQEPFISSTGEFGDVVIAIFATVAKIERDRISKRTKAGLKRAVKGGSKLGRPKGTKDKRKRVRKFWKKR